MDQVYRFVLEATTSIPSLAGTALWGDHRRGYTSCTVYLAGSNVPVRIYQPEQTEKPILLIFYHGGGYCIGSCDTYHGVCQSLSQLANCVIASVEYRLAPENKFPAAFEDVLACTKWFLSGENRQSVGLPRDAVVGVCGDSAGGCLAAAITHHLKLDTTSIMFQVRIWCFELQEWQIADSVTVVGFDLSWS